MAKAELQRKPAPSSTVEAARVTAAAEPADAERKEEAAPFAEPQPAPHPSAEVAQIGVAIHEEDERQLHLPTPHTLTVLTMRS